MGIRRIRECDAEKFTVLSRKVESSSNFMLWEEGERNITPEEQRERINILDKSKNSAILVAEYGDELVGFIVAIGGSARRNKHSVYLVIGVLEDYRGQGIGTKLFEEAEKWAMIHKIHRLELTAATRNNAGLSLYKKMGFEIEGTKRHSLFIDGNFVDEYYMAKLLIASKDRQDSFSSSQCRGF